MGFWDWITGNTDTREQPATPPVSTPAATPALSEAALTCAVLEEEPQNSETIPPWWVPQGESLLELTTITRPELSAEARALENLLMLHFDGRNLTLPSLPHVPEKVLRILSAGNGDMRQVAQEIGKDQVSAAAVLRMANSPLYCGLQKITALEPAVVRLGSNAVRTAMLNLSIRSVTFREQRKGNNRAEMLWQRALASATIMRALSSFTKVNPEEAFLIGLLHDVGNIIVLRIVNTQQASSRLAIYDPTFEYLCHEAHQEFGELLADAWALPERLKSLICDHHAYPVLGHPFRIERLQLQFADMICSLLGYAPTMSYDLLACRPAQDLGLTDRPDFVPFLESLPATLDDSLASMG